MKIKIIIQTKNEAEKIVKCVKKAKRLTDDVLVIDSGSTDNTVELAKQAGARVTVDDEVSENGMLQADFLDATIKKLENTKDNLKQMSKEKLAAIKREMPQEFLSEIVSFVIKVFKKIKKDVRKLSKKQFGDKIPLVKGKVIPILNNSNYCDIFTVVALIGLFVGIWFTQGTGNVGTVLCVLALLWQFHLHKVNALSDDNKKLLKVFGLWAGAVLLSTFYGEQPFHWISRWANLYVWCSLPLGLLVILRRKEKWNKIALAVSIAVLTIICGLLAYEGIKYHQRAGAIIETNVMAMASVLSVTLPMVFVSFLDERIFGKYRWMVLPAFVICNIGLLYNQTRGAWLACGIMYIVAAALYFRRDIKITTVVLVMGLVAGSFICGNSYISSRWTLDPSHSSNASRVRIWTSAYQIWKDNPILGSGYRTFEKLYQTKYISKVASAEEKGLTHAHNNWMMVLAEQGIFGEIFFWLCYGSIFLYGAKEYRKYRDPYSLMIAMIVAGTLIQGSTECNLHMPYFTRIFWTMTGWSIYTHAIWKGKQSDGTSKN